MRIQLKKLEAEEEVCNDFETVISYAESASPQKHKSLPRWHFGPRPVTHALSAPPQLHMPGVLPSGVSRSVAEDHVIGAPPQSVLSHSFGEPVNPHAQSAPPQLHMPGVLPNGVSRSVAQDHVIGAPPQSVLSHSFGEPVNPHAQSAPPQLHMPGVLPSGVSRSVAQDHVIGAPPQSVMSHSFGEPVNPHAQSAPPQLHMPGVLPSGVSRSVAQDHVIGAPPQSVLSHSFGEPVNPHAQSAPPQLHMPGVLPSGVSRSVTQDHVIGAPPQSVLSHSFGEPVNPHAQSAPPQLHMPGVLPSGVSRSVTQDHVIGAPPQSVLSHSFGEPVSPHAQSAPPQLHMPGVLPSGVSRSVAQDHVIGAPRQSVVSHSFGEPVNPHAQSVPPQLHMPGVLPSGVSRSVAQDHVIGAPPQSVLSHSFGEPVNPHAQSAPPQLHMPGVSRSGVSRSVAQDHVIGAPPYAQPAPSRRLAPESGSHAFDNTAAVNQPADISVPQIQQSVTCISQEAPQCYDMNVPPEDNISMQEEINDPGIEYLETMRKLATATLLPKSELMKFDGDPLKYFSFIKSFENNVEKDICDSSRQLQLLTQYCTGKVKKVIENCILLSPSEGYKEAKKLLAERFGNVYKVTNSWICKVTNGPVIKPGDREALIDLADDLHNCELTLKATGRLNQVNNEDCLVKILERCPGFVKSRWQSKVYEFRERGHNPNIEDVRILVRMVAVEKNDPVFGAIMERDGSKQTTRDKRMRRPGQVADKSSHNKHVNFKIQTTAEQKPKDTESNARCYLCEGKHKLEACEDFKSKTGEEQLQFIRSRKLCDNCLSSNHFSAGCKRRNECKVPDCPLRRKHMTSLHESVMAFEKKRRETTTSGATRDQQQSRGTSKS